MKLLKKEKSISSSSNTSAPTASLDAVLVTQPLRQIANCLGYLAINSGDLKGKSKEELMPILASFGFDKRTIAVLLQTDVKSVVEKFLKIKSIKKGGSKSDDDD